LVSITRRGEYVVKPRTDPPFARVSSRRDVVLAALRAASGSTSVEEVAAGLDLHVNTVRFHLRRLVADGLAEQTTEARTVRGRPRVLFRARAEASGARSYLMLAQMMAETAAATGDLGAAERTGHTWGMRLLAEADGLGAGTAGVETHLGAVLDSIGFAPRIEPDGTGLAVTLEHCPFVEVARQHPGPVCGMHGALIQGVLDGLDSGMQVRELLPFVPSGGCVARVGA
jgi:predicted ArsR family transcriptional regulator